MNKVLRRGDLAGYYTEKVLQLCHSKTVFILVPAVLLYVTVGPFGEEMAAPQIIQIIPLVGCLIVQMACLSLKRYKISFTLA